MSITALPDITSFRTVPLRGLPEGSRVNKDEMTIYGAKAMQIGPLNEGDARPWKVDSVTLQQLVSAVNLSNSGVKMRMSHPNMSRDGMGRHLGRAKNARIIGEGEQTFVAVDAKISETARKSPNGNAADYVLDLAAEAPEDFGLSIAPILDLPAMEKQTPDENGLVAIRIKGLRAIDFVDEPAATRGGLFSVTESESLADLPSQATWLLDTFFSDAPADVIRARFSEFLETYFRTKGVPMSTFAAEQTIPETQKPEAPLSTPDGGNAAAASLELRRIQQINALCQLAKVPDDQKKLLIDAGFSVAQAQDWVKTSGHLSLSNPPISEGGSDLEKKPASPEDAFGEEFDANKDIYEMLGVTREQYIESRKIG